MISRKVCSCLGVCFGAVGLFTSTHTHLPFSPSPSFDHPLHNLIVFIKLVPLVLSLLSHQDVVGGIKEAFSLSFHSHFLLGLSRVNIP